MCIYVCTYVHTGSKCIVQNLIRKNKKYKAMWYKLAANYHIALVNSHGCYKFQGVATKDFIS